MDFISERRLEKKAVARVLLLCLLPQLIRIILSCIYEYEIAGNHMYPTLVGDICLYGADILGQFSFFSILGSSVCLSFRHGLRSGGEWTLLYIGLYIVAYFALTQVPYYLFGLAVFGISALVSMLAVVLSAKKGRKAMAAAALTLLVPLFGGIIQQYASDVPSLDEIVYVLFYAVANLGFELLFLLVACRMADMLRKRDKGDTSLSGKLITLKNPVMLTMLVFDALFIIFTSLENTVQIADNLIEYGPPVNTAEWMSIIGVYARYAVVFVIGYAAMRLSAGLIESAYASEDEK